jgi:hypothetical protein
MIGYQNKRSRKEQYKQTPKLIQKTAMEMAQATNYAETMIAMRNKLKHAFKETGKGSIVRGGEAARQVFKSGSSFELAESEFVR